MRGKAKAIFILLALSPLIYDARVSAFTPQSAKSNVGAFGAPSRRHDPSTHRRKVTTSHNVVFNKLSEDCITALDTAQAQASLLHQDEVDDTLALLGLTHAPGRAKSTLDKYHITWDNVHRVLNYLDPTSTSSSGSNNDNNPNPSRVPRLSDFNARTAGALPYSASLYRTIYAAGHIADVMGSPWVRAEHLFLALLQYKEDPATGAMAATRGDDCDAMEIVWHIDATLEGENICFDLLNALMEEEEEEKAAPDSATATKDEAKALAEGKGKEENKSILQKFGVDMTQQARDGDLDKVTGRDVEIQNCLQILLRRRKNNVCLIGEAGVGKTSIVEGLAQILVSKEECPALLIGHRIVSIEVAALLAGTQYRGEFEARLRAVLEEVASEDSRPTILFLDEIHTLVGAGSTEGGSMDAANIIKPALARGQIQVIGATTITEYRKFIASDAALERRLQPVLIQEPTVNQTVGILQALLPFYSAHHRVEFSPESLEAAARLSDRFIADRFLPDKAIDVLDEAGALATLTRDPSQPPPVVTEKEIASIISKWTSIPVGKLEMDEMDRLQHLEDSISLRIKGQQRAVQTVAKAIRRARAGIRNPRRPIASLLFCGPTGTGKTELCKTLAQTYFGSERDLIRIDMSEYMVKFSVSRLTGPPPGYKGYEEGGQLTEAVRRSPYAVVLLDEMEKAHGDVLNILLQVIEDGILTDGQGRTVSFKNTILIMTSNIGSSRVLEMAEGSVDGKSDSGADNAGRSKQYSKLAGAVTAELEETLRPEFLNRIDDVVIFEPLSEYDLFLIAASMVREISTRAKMERNIGIGIAPALLEKIVEEGKRSSSKFGARPMRRAVQRIFEDSVSECIVQGFLADGDEAMFELRENSDEQEDCFHVTAIRSRDDEQFCVEVENSSRYIVADDRPTLDSVEATEEVDKGPNGAGAALS